MTDKEKIHIEFWASLDALNEVEKLRQSVNIDEDQQEAISNLYHDSIIRLKNAATVYVDILNQELMQNRGIKIEE